MAKAAKGKKPATTDSNIVIADGEELNLHNRHLAAFLAWVVPGAGHYYQQRYFKSAIFSASVFSTFFIGMVIANFSCVYAAWNGTERRWQFALQSGVGFVAIPAAIQGYTSRGGNDPILGSMLTAPKNVRELHKLHRETASGFDMGTLYTMIAGLLNVLVVFDAYAGPLPPPVPKKKGDPDSEEEEKSSAKDDPPDRQSAEST